LRGIAALMIVFFHVVGIPQLELPPALMFIKNYFGMGVPLFFVISAFSLFLSTSTKVGNDGWVQTYFIKRFFRVAPLFYMMLIVYIAFYYYALQITYSWSEIFLNVSFLYNLFPGKHESMVWAGWTIGVEMLFYLVLPYFLMNIRSVPRALAFSLGCMVLSAIARGMYEELELPSSYPYMNLLSQLGVFSAGIPAYFIYMKYREHEHVKYIGLVMLISFVILTTWAALDWARVIAVFGYRITFWAYLFGLLVLSQLFYPFVLISNKFFAFLGEISFSLYLLHPLLIYALRPVYQAIYGYGLYTGYAYLLCVTITLLLLIPVAYIVYKVVETRSIRAGNWVISKRLHANGTF